jgi:hypothetical protein
LTNGESSDVDVVRIAPGQQITVRLSDGTERVLPWEWIESVELAPAQPPPAPPGQVVQQAPAPPAAAAAGAPPSAPRVVVPANPEVTFKRNALQAQYDQLVDQRPGVGWPTTLLCVGLTVGISGLFLGGLAAASNAQIDDSYSTYGSSSSEKVSSTPFFVVGGLASAAAIGSIVWLVSRIGERKQIDEKLGGMKQEIDRLQLSVAPLRDGAYAGMSWSL